MAGTCQQARPHAALYSFLCMPWNRMSYGYRCIFRRAKASASARTRICSNWYTSYIDSGCPTELTAWFESNAKHEAGRHLLYADYIDLFVWLPQLHCWMPRQRGHGKTIGRMYFIPPSAGENYFLRVLLTHVAGATSFEDL